MGQLVRKSAKVLVGESGSVCLAVVADTHSQPHVATAQRLAELAPAAILHGGDIGDLGVLEQLAQIAPVYAVRGNIDTRAHELPDVLTLEVGTLRILMTHIAVYGVKIRAEVATLAREARASLVVCGHSHVPFIGKDKGLTVFNPGSIGPRRFQLPIVLGKIDITPSGARLGHIDCETGAAWLPPP
jgi:putative phosphoesterase